MELNTAGSFITYISKIEQESADLYARWAEQHDELGELFLTFAKENRKNEKAVKGAYYSVVSDALETNFCFKGLRVDVEMPRLSEKAPASAAVQASIDLEDSIQVFYTKAAQSCKAFLADVSRAVERVARLRRARLEKLRSR
jgi:hypothetical protein